MLRPLLNAVMLYSSLTGFGCGDSQPGTAPIREPAATGALDGEHVALPVDSPGSDDASQGAKPASTSDNEESKPPIEYRPQTRPFPRGLVAPGERSLRRERFSAEVLVLHNGESVEKAHVAVRYIRRTPDGRKRVTQAFMDASSSLAQTINDDGLFKSLTSFDGNDANPRFEVVAFHPELGTAHAEVTLDDLMSGELTALELQRGEAVVGTVLDEAGNPVDAAAVRITTICHIEGVSQVGLEVLSNPDGSFYLPGIRFENKLDTIYVSYEEAAPGYERLQHSRSVPKVHQYGRIGASKITYDPSTATWDAGDIVISPPIRGSSFMPRSQTR